MNLKLLFKESVLLRYNFILLLMFSPLAYAGNGGGVPDGLFVFILVAWSTLFALVHFAIISLLSLGKHFKHLWLVTVSLFLSVASALFWIYSVGFLIFHTNELDLAYLILVAIVSILIVFLIIRDSKFPLRQYREMTTDRLMSSATGKAGLSKNKIEKPVGIIVITIYTGLKGIYILIIGTVSIYYMLHSDIMNISTLQDGNVWYYLMIMESILFAAFSLVSIYGLWSMQRWGWRTTFWLYIISIVLDIISMFSDYLDSVLIIGIALIRLFGIAVAVAVILYLKKDEIQKLYPNPDIESQ